jgi:hypothetical protein
MRLNGWWRFLIVLASLNFFGVLGYLIHEWPDISSVQQGPWLLYRLNDSSQALMRETAPTLLQLKQQLAESAADLNTSKKLVEQIEDLEKNPWKQSPVLIQGANGQEFSIKANSTDEQIQLLRKDFYEVLRNELITMRIALLVKAAAFFLVPVFTLILFAYAFAWVRRGFVSESK